MFECVFNVIFTLDYVWFKMPLSVGSGLNLNTFK